jgi:hypothetical protein
LLHVLRSTVAAVPKHYLPDFSGAWTFQTLDHVVVGGRAKQKEGY